MRRRAFLKNSLLTCGGLALPTKVQGKGTVKGKPYPRLHVQYIREKIAPFEIPPYRGQSYEDRIPDTLDIAEQAKLAIHAVTSIADPIADDEIFWLADFSRNPPVLVHNFNDWVQNQEGLMEALPLLRLATGSDLNAQVDPVWMSTTLKSIGPDGLFYYPLNGRPWSRLDADGVNPVWRDNGTTTTFQDPSVSQFASAATCARIVSTMTVYYLRDRNPIWKTTIEKVIRRLSDVAITKDDYCYFPAGSFEPNAKVDVQAEIPVGTGWSVTWNTRLIQGLMQYYSVTGYEPARELAAKVNRFSRYHMGAYDAETGAWLLESEIRGRRKWGPYDVEGLKFGGEGSGHGVGLISMLEYGMVTGDRETLDFVKASYEWAKNPGSEYGVSSLVGWFPTWYLPGYEGCETCTVAYMLGIAVKLSEAGKGDYWDEIDRWVRNYFSAAQLKEFDWIYSLTEGESRKPVAANETRERVPERSIGAWPAGANGNDWGVPIITHCCTGNAARAVYYVLEHMVDYREGGLRVNLLLNRASRWADVYSYIPYQGRVEVKMKEACASLQVRAPEWAEAQSPHVVCNFNGKSRSLRWEGRYVDVGAVTAGGVVSVTFPLPERTLRENIGPVNYTLILKGNTVVSIAPTGQTGAFYQDRDKYRGGKLQWRKVKRFVPEEEIHW
jgi:hypothetical protein